ncbi:MAG: hypothetical protein JOZ41_21950 [Chloroflexi bacterium]|nr:hypothetical protein [Chloroflexota bacterium]
MTYPEPAVAQLVQESFIPVQINTQEEAAKPIIERYRQAWTPDIRVLGPDGFDYGGWNGYLPPFEYVPQLLAAEGRARLRMGDLPRAAEVYGDVFRRFPTSALAPEALYYLAVSKYKASHEGKDLVGTWHRLQTTYPASIWRVKQSFSENKRPGE